MQYFNKLIDITFVGEKDSFSIKTPRTGMKPQISISGEFTSKALITTLEIRITNLYINKILTNYHKVLVSAGYENNMSSVFEGEIVALYTAMPGPNKETVIICATANVTEWIEKDVNLSLESGFSLKQAIEEISNILSFQTPYIDTNYGEKTSAAPLLINGTVNMAIDELKKLFPNTQITIDSNRIYCYPEKTKDVQKELVKKHKIPFLSQAPQFAGDQVSLVAPWMPNIKPQEIVEFGMGNYYVTGQYQSSIFKTARVAQISFSFSTTGENSMSIVGVKI